MADHHDDVRFEPTDVRIGPIVWFLAILGGSLAIIMVVLWWTQVFELRSHDVADRVPPQKMTFPPEPRIEGVGMSQASHSVTNPDIPTSAKSQRIEEEKKLADGWTDAAGKKHPPIDQAMQAVVEKLKKEGKK